MIRPLTHTLIHPILFEKKRPDSDEFETEELKPAGFLVTMRRPKGADMKAFDRNKDPDTGYHNEMAALIEMIARCSNLSGIEADNLDGVDFELLGNLLVPKRGGGPATGSSA